MPVAKLGDVEIAYEDHGSTEDPPLLLIAGLGNQMYFFEDDFVQALTDRAFCVIRFDNRDSGLSTAFDEEIDIGALVEQLGSGGSVRAPYSVGDMAADVVGLLDHLGIDRAHLLGVSLGGMIAQCVAIEHPGRVQSLTLLSSTTGAPDVGQPAAESLAALLAPGPGGDRDAIVAADVETRRIWASSEHFDEDWARQYFADAYDRSHRPGGMARQLAAVLSEGSREDALALLHVPTLVAHGTEDKLISPDGGARLAEIIPGATLLELEGMGHDLPPHYWAPLIESVTQLAIRSISVA